MVFLGADGTAAITPADVDGGSYDNCGLGPLMLVSPNTFDCDDLGDNAVVLTVFDQTGRSDTCVATVVVRDKQKPVLTCNDVEAPLWENGRVIVDASQVATATDNCGGPVRLDPPYFQYSCGSIGPHVVTITAEDDQGNKSTCTATITVVDEEPPTIACQDTTVSIGSLGFARIGVSSVASASDNCDDVTLLPRILVFGCGDLGPNQRTITATDGSGNSITCTATVTVVDNLPPTAVCQDVTLVIGDTGQVTLGPADVDGGSTDNCGIDHMDLDVTTFDCSDVGQNPVTLTVWDASGNSSACTATVTVETPPLCKDAEVVLDANGQGSITPADVLNFLCGGVSSATVSPSAIDCTNLGPNTVTLTVVDVTGVVHTCEATVTVVDTTPPEIHNCMDAVVPCNHPDGYLWSPDVTDNCGVDAVTVLVDGITWTTGVIPFGPHDVTVVATDASMNEATCSFFIEVLGDFVEPLRLPSDPLLDGGVSGSGATPNPINPNFYIGDDAQAVQHVGMLSFDLTALPAGAQVTSARLRLTRTGQSGNPLALGMPKFDMAIPSLGTPALESSDHYAPATMPDAGVPVPIPPGPGATMYVPLKAAALPLLQGPPMVQFRVRFPIPTNGDATSDGIQVGAGDYGPGHPYTPELIIEYYSPSCNGCGEQDPPVSQLQHTVTIGGDGGTDGHVEESHEDSDVGHYAPTNGRILYVGDDAGDKQVMAVLSFDTSSLGAAAHILSARLELVYQGKSGNPVNPGAPEHMGDLVVDMRCANDPPSYYGSVPATEAQDFQAYSHITNATIAPVGPAGGGLYAADLTPEAAAQINKNGLTQMKLRFTRDDNDNQVKDQLHFYSGDNVLSLKPRLVIEYLAP